MKQNLKKVFDHYQKRKNTDANLKPSAVLVPLFYKEDHIQVLLTLRSEQVLYHKGQICFPGGTYQYSDITLLRTALRETEEEIGLTAGDVEVLGELDDRSTTSSRYAISPFVALIPYPYVFKPNYNEIKQIISIPLSELTNELHYPEPSTDLNEQFRINCTYHYENYVIWGVTARILNQLIELLELRNGAPG